MSSTITSDRISHTYGYAWLGTAGKSASTATRDGVEVRRNMCTNPGFEVDVSGWTTSSLTVTDYAWVGTANASQSIQRVNSRETRRNLASDPRATSLSITNGQIGWSSRWFGNGSSGTNSLVTNAYDGPDAITSYARKTWDKVSSLMDIAWSHTAGGTSGFPVVASATYTLSVKLRASQTQSSQHGSTGLIVQWCDSSGTQIGSTFLQQPDPLVAGVWLRFSGTVTAPANAAYAVIYTQLYLTNAPWSPGDTLDGTALLVERTSTLGDYFDGYSVGSSKGLDVLRSTQASHSGLASMQVRWRSQSPGGLMYATTPVGGLIPDTDYVASLWISIPIRLSKPLTLSVVTNGSGIVGPDPITLQEATVGWQRIVMPFRTATNRTSVDIWLVDPNSYTGGYVSQSLYIDDILVETGGAILPYFDGGTLGYVEFENTRPLVVNGWNEEAEGQNVVNPVIGGGFDVTLREASLRSGAFELVYATEEDAAAAFTMHRQPTTFTISDSDRSSIAMTYVVNGRISRTLDDETREYWIVRVEYQEVGS